MTNTKRFRLSLLILATTCLPVAVLAETPTEALQRLERKLAAQQEQLQLQQRRLNTQSSRLSEQEQLIEHQSQLLDEQYDELKDIRSRLHETDLRTRRAAGPAPAPASEQARTPRVRVSQAGTPPEQPVGQAPPEQNEQKVSRPEVQAIANIGGVLTPKGQWILEPAIQFSNSQVNRLSFQGVEILETFLIGILEAENADRDLISPSLTLRYGITPRLEIEGKLPYIWRNDRLEATIPATVSQQQPQLTRDLEGDGIGDAELALHYQLNAGRGGWPIFLGNIRYKSDTGDGPYDVDRDNSGNQTELPTGSGFHSVEPSITALYPSDPAVFYANLGYLYNISENVNRTFVVEGGDNQRIGKVDPGDAVRLSFGMAYSINSKASFSLGYKHDFIQETDSEINNVTLSSSSLDVGSMLLGFSHRLTPKLSANVNLELGVTADSPDVALTLRLPYTLN